MSPCLHEYRVLEQVALHPGSESGGETARRGASAAELKRVQSPVLRVRCWQCGCELQAARKFFAAEPDRLL